MLVVFGMFIKALFANVISLCYSFYSFNFLLRLFIAINTGLALWFILFFK